MLHQAILPNCIFYCIFLFSVQDGCQTPFFSSLVNCRELAIYLTCLFNDFIDCPSSLSFGFKRVPDSLLAMSPHRNHVIVRDPLPRSRPIMFVFFLHCFEKFFYFFFLSLAMMYFPCRRFRVSSSALPCSSPYLVLFNLGALHPRVQFSLQVSERSSVLFPQKLSSNWLGLPRAYFPVSAQELPSPLYSGLPQFFLASFVVVEVRCEILIFLIPGASIRFLNHRGCPSVLPQGVHAPQELFSLSRPFAISFKCFLQSADYLSLPLPSPLDLLGQGGEPPS